MRVPNMIKLAQEVGEYDLVLGGHDHFYNLDVINETVCLVSGTDFRGFSSINIYNNNIQDTHIQDTYI